MANKLRKFLRSLSPRRRFGDTSGRNLIERVMYPVAFFEVRLPRRGEFEGGESHLMRDRWGVRPGLAMGCRSDDLLLCDGAPDARQFS